MEPVTIETTVAYPAKWRVRDEERLIMFTIPFHEDLRPYLRTPMPKAIPCYYRNLRFKYSTLTKGTSIKITANIEKGTRGGVQLHIKEIEIIGEAVKDLTKVNAKMLNKWTKQFEKQNSGEKPQTLSKMANLKVDIRPTGKKLTNMEHNILEAAREQARLGQDHLFMRLFVEQQIEDWKKRDKYRNSLTRLDTRSRWEMALMNGTVELAILKTII